MTYTDRSMKQFCDEQQNSSEQILLSFCVKNVTNS